MNNKTEKTNTIATMEGLLRMQQRRKLLGGVVAAAGAMATALPGRWVSPVVDAVILPAHAQTSVAMCMTDTTVGGPLLGNPTGATTCEAACEAEAAAQGAQLCDVRTTVDGNGATQCDCDLDLP